MPALIKDPAAGLSSLPSNFEASKPQLRYQGAEALIYKTSFPVAAGAEQAISAKPAFLKHRPSKPYRHPILDARLTRHRILAEARVLAKLKREGVAVPAIYALDWEAGWMLGEWIDGRTIRAVLDEVVPKWIQSTSPGRTDSDAVETSSDPLTNALRETMAKIGRLVGKVHASGVVHGDLTTSNIMLRPHQNIELQELLPHDVKTVQGDVYLIDFGLTDQSIQAEDQAVDLYVLERAFGSSHPQSEQLFQELLAAYGNSYRGARGTLKRLDEVRLRGRKKIMIG